MQRIASFLLFLFCVSSSVFASNDFKKERFFSENQKYYIGLNMGAVAHGAKVMDFSSLPGGKFQVSYWHDKESNLLGSVDSNPHFGLTFGYRVSQYFVLELGGFYDKDVNLAIFQNKNMISFKPLKSELKSEKEVLGSDMMRFDLLLRSADFALLSDTAFHAGLKLSYINMYDLKISPEESYMSHLSGVEDAIKNNKSGIGGGITFGLDYALLKNLSIGISGDICYFPVMSEISDAVVNGLNQKLIGNFDNTATQNNGRVVSVNLNLKYRF